MTFPTTAIRSWLFVPGNSAPMMKKAFGCGADAVVLDLEDGVSSDAKAQARELVGQMLREQTAWVRINRPKTAAAESDLKVVGTLAAGIRVPKVESADDVAWVADRARNTPLACTIETAVGLMNAYEIAARAPTVFLVLGAADLVVDLRLGDGVEPLLYPRAQIAIASRAAGIAAPIDGAYTGPDGDGLRQSAELARRMGFSGKSAVRPIQVPVINNAFTPSPSELAWAKAVIEAFEASGGAVCRLADGSLVDKPIATRARLLLDRAGT